MMPSLYISVWVVGTPGGRMVLFIFLKICLRERERERQEGGAEGDISTRFHIEHRAQHRAPPQNPEITT